MEQFLQQMEAARCHYFEERLQKIERRLRIVDECRIPIRPAGKSDEYRNRMFTTTVPAIVGLREALTAKKWWVKCAWWLFLVAGVAATIYYICEATKDYLEKPTAIKVSFLSDTQLEYPPFQVCPDSWLDVPKAIEMGLSVEALKYSLGYLVDDPLVYFFDPLALDAVDIARRQFEQFYARRNFSNLFDYFQSVALDAEFEYDQPLDENRTVVFRCYQCNVTRGIRKVLRDHRVCYEFHWNAINIKTARRDRSPLLNISLPHRTQRIYPSSSSLWIYVKESSTSIPLAFPQDKVSILFLSRQHFHRLNTETQPCSDDGDYSYEACVDGCYQQTTAPSPHCRPLRQDKGETVQLEHFCNSHLHPPPEQGDLAAITCVDSCVAPCKTTMYHIGIEPLFDYLTNDSSVSYTTMGMVDTAVVSGPIMQFHEISSYSFATLVGNVGGMLGIFVGCTLMTFVQLILAVVEYVYDGSLKLFRLRSQAFC